MFSSTMFSIWSEQIVLIHSQEAYEILKKFVPPTDYNQIILNKSCKILEIFLKYNIENFEKYVYPRTFLNGPIILRKYFEYSDFNCNLSIELYRINSFNLNFNLKSININFRMYEHNSIYDHIFIIRTEFSENGEIHSSWLDVPSNYEWGNTYQLNWEEFRNFIDIIIKNPDMTYVDVKKYITPD